MRARDDLPKHLNSVQEHRIRMNDNNVLLYTGKSRTSYFPDSALAKELRLKCVTHATFLRMILRCF